MTDLPHDAFATVALPALAEAFGLGRLRSRQFLTEGLMNRNWRVETTTGTYAVKEITDVPLAKARRNLAVLPGLARDGLPIHVALLTAGGENVVEIAGHGFCVLPWVEGAHVPGTGLSIDHTHELGILLAHLHQSLSRHPPAPGPVTPPVAKIIDSGSAANAADALRVRLSTDTADVLDKQAVEALYQRKDLLTRHAPRQPSGDRPAGPYGWTHGDFQYRNLLRQENDVVAVLDWDRLAVRPYAEEVARTAQVQFGVDGHLDLTRVAAFVSGYRSVIELPEDDLAEAMDRLWWKRATDFWQLEFYLERSDPTFGNLFLEDEVLLHWWTDHLAEVQAAFAVR